MIPIPATCAGVCPSSAMWGFTKLYWILCPSARGVGLLYLIIGLGLLKAKRWAWTTALITAPISIIASALAIVGEWGIGVSGAAFFPVPSLLFAVVIILYLPRANVKDYFGKISLQEELF